MATKELVHVHGDEHVNAQEKWADEIVSGRRPTMLETPPAVKVSIDDFMPPAPPAPVAKPVVKSNPNEGPAYRTKPGSQPNRINLATYSLEQPANCIEIGKRAGLSAERCLEHLEYWMNAKLKVGLAVVRTKVDGGILDLFFIPKS